VTYSMFRRENLILSYGREKPIQFGFVEMMDESLCHFLAGAKAGEDLPVPRSMLLRGASTFRVELPGGCVLSDSHGCDVNRQHEPIPPVTIPEPFETPEGGQRNIF